jgi:RimJ/RimL family protein N-acetyltransferase
VLESPVLEGQFVRLEPLTLAHLDGLLQAASGPRETFALTGVPHDAASTRAYIARALAEQHAGTSIAFATLDIRSGQVAGTTRFMRIEYWDWPTGSPFQRGEDLPDALEIGATWLAAWAQRTGINTEAKLLMLTHAFEAWHTYRVRFSTDARNARSRAAIERLGARAEGVLRAHHAAYDGAIRDSAFYSILESEWPEAKKALTQRLRLD